MTSFILQSLLTLNIALADYNLQRLQSYTNPSDPTPATLAAEFGPESTNLYVSYTSSTNNIVRFVRNPSTFTFTASSVISGLGYSNVLAMLSSRDGNYMYVASSSENRLSRATRVSGNLQPINPSFSLLDGGRGFSTITDMHLTNDSNESVLYAFSQTERSLTFFTRSLTNGSLTYQGRKDTFLPGGGLPAIPLANASTLRFEDFDISPTGNRIAVANSNQIFFFRQISPDGFLDEHSYIDSSFNTSGCAYRNFSLQFIDENNLLVGTQGAVRKLTYNPTTQNWSCVNIYSSSEVGFFTSIKVLPLESPTSLPSVIISTGGNDPSRNIRLINGFLFFLPPPFGGSFESYSAIPSNIFTQASGFPILSPQQPIYSRDLNSVVVLNGGNPGSFTIFKLAGDRVFSNSFE